MLYQRKEWSLSAHPSREKFFLQFVPRPWGQFGPRSSCCTCGERCVYNLRSSDDHSCCQHYFFRGISTPALTSIAFSFLSSARLPSIMCTWHGYCFVWYKKEKDCLQLVLLLILLKFQCYTCLGLHMATHSWSQASTWGGSCWGSPWARGAVNREDRTGGSISETFKVLIETFELGRA